MAKTLLDNALKSTAISFRRKDLLLLGMKKFLQERLALEKPILVGYSGGPDSKALLHLILECRRFFSIDLHLAHIDHGWREESRLEAAAIAEEARAVGVPLHMQVLSYEDFGTRNLEEQGRIRRYQFFSEIYAKLGCQALLLGHHAGDQAEVVLKRVCEGASLFSMGGLALQSEFRGMQIWRPLLPTSKREILDWLAQKELPYFQDPTNRSSRFLRGRMREEMIPALQKSFGKGIESNFCLLGEESREVREYFIGLNHPLLERIEKEGFLNLTPALPALQLKYLLKEWIKKEEVAFSRQAIEGVVAAVISRASHKKFQSKDGFFLIEKDRISLYKGVNICL